MFCSPLSPLSNSKVFQVNDKVFVGLAGLATDVLSLHQLLQFRHKMYELQEHRE
ncbi:hypothetical protein EON64_20950, partial [archaeon]